MPTLWSFSANCYQFQSIFIEPKESTNLGVPVGAAVCILLRPSVGNFLFLGGRWVAPTLKWTMRSP